MTLSQGAQQTHSALDALIRCVLSSHAFLLQRNVALIEE
jgi:hypothetical protein